MQHVRRAFIVAVIAGTMLAGKPSLAQDNASGDTAAVERAVETMRTAMVAADRQGLEATAAEQLSYGHSDGHVQNRAQYVDDIVGKSAPFASITLSKQTVALSGHDAIVRHVFDAKQIVKGQPTDIHIGVLQVWQNESGQWRLLARQAVKLPPA